MYPAPFPEGQWGIGGNPLTAAMVHEMQKG